MGIDISLPVSPVEPAGKHPLINVINEICGVFEDLGFEIQEGTEVETEWYNFQALNIPLEHPSRDMFDTFYLNLSADKNKGKYLLRSHTSPSQIRIMEKRKPPLAVVVPGKVYRPDNVDASHSFMFHQIEGFAVGENINFSHLKGVLIEFARQAFSPETKLRFRPHFFPFTEPSAEVDVWHPEKKQWIELGGSGIFRPEVVQPLMGEPIPVLAWGLGMERSIMEFIRDGENVSGERGEIVLTDLHNYSFPFIRYKVEDVGILSDEKCSCGRGLPLIREILGRTRDFVVTPSGKLIHGGFFSHIFWEKIEGVIQFQVIQEKVDELLIKIIPNSDFTDESIQKIGDIIRLRMGNVNVKVVLTDKIPIPESGKWHQVISKVSKQYFQE